MKLTYIYHSCYAIETEKLSIVIDYLRDDRDKTVFNKIISGKKPVYILSTHGHHDHFNPEILKWKDSNKNCKYIFSKDILNSGLAKITDAIYLDKDETYEDDFLKIKAFGSTDLGVSFKIFLDGKVLFHAGDLNNWHWKDESTAKEAAEAEKFFLDELDHLADETLQLDVAMFPVDPRLGKDYALGAKQFMEKIPTRLFVPMHFDEGYTKALIVKVIAHKLGTDVFVPVREGAYCELE